MKHTYMTRCLSFLLLLGTLVIYHSGTAQDLKPVSKTYVIRNATVVQSPGNSIAGADVVISDGLITAVGKGISVPPDAQTVKGDSLVVYAGFIDGLSHAGLEEPKRNERPNVKDPGNPPNDIAGITPYVDVRELLNPDDKSIGDLRALGFTVSHTVPYGNMLPGTGSIILLGGAEEGSIILKDNASLYSQFQGARGVYPNTVIGIMAKYRELYRQAGLSKNDAARYSSGTAARRPSEDRVLEAFYPVIDGEIPVAFQAEGIKDVYRALQLQEDLGFRLMLCNVKQAWDISDLLKSSNAPVFIGLALPEWKEEAKDSTLTGAEAEEYEKLFTRKEEILKEYYGQAALLSSKSVQYGFATAGLKPADFHKNILKMKEQGATEDQLLAALTTAPAGLLGLSRRMGTVETGKMANLVVTDKNFFEEEATVLYVFVEGTKYEFEKKSKKEKKGENAKDEISPVGKWSFTASPGGETATGTIEIEEEANGYTGTLSYDQAGSDYDLSNITFSGNTMTFSLNINDGGQYMSFTGTIEFTTDSYTGSVNSPQTGSFPISGKKIP